MTSLSNKLAAGAWPYQRPVPSAFVGDSMASAFAFK